MSPVASNEDLNDVILRVEANETEHDRLRKDVEEIKISVEEILVIFRTAKAGANLVVGIAYGLKWIGMLAVAVLSVWALWKAIETGTIPTPSITKIPD